MSDRSGSQICSPREFIDAVRETYEEWVEYHRQEEPSFVGCPDFEAAIDYVEAHGIGPCP